MRTKPKVICLCGSTRYPTIFEYYRKKFTLEGCIVLDTGGIYGHTLSSFDMSGPVKKMLDQLHFSRIDLADEIFVINPDGRIGFSTCNEILYALSLGKKVTFKEIPYEDEREWDAAQAEFFKYCMDEASLINCDK